MAAALELREAEPGQADRGEQEQLDGVLDLLVGEPDRRRPRRAAAVVDEDVDPAEGRERAVDQSLEVGRVGDVAAHRERAQALGFLLQQLAPAREHRDVGALGRERLRDRQAHPREAPQTIAVRPLSPSSMRYPEEPSTPTTSRTASAEVFSAWRSSSLSSSSTISSIPLAPSFTGTPM